MTDTQFIDYMKAFEASTAHMNSCVPCQNDQPCKAGLPIHEDFAAKQDAWEARK